MCLPLIAKQNRKPGVWEIVTRLPTSRSPLKPWLCSPCPQWVTPHLDSEAKRTGQQHCPRGYPAVSSEKAPGQSLTSVPPARARQTRRISGPMLGTSSRGSFSPLREGQQPEPPPLPCKGPCRLPQGVCAKGCHAAPESLGNKELHGHRGLLSDSLICCVAVNGGMPPTPPPSTPVFLQGRFSISQSQPGF